MLMSMNQLWDRKILIQEWVMGLGCVRGCMEGSGKEGGNMHLCVQVGRISGRRRGAKASIVGPMG